LAKPASADGDEEHVTDHTLDLIAIDDEIIAHSNRALRCRMY
jgi:hypothetical protein